MWYTMPLLKWQEMIEWYDMTTNITLKDIPVIYMDMLLINMAHGLLENKYWLLI